MDFGSMTQGTAVIRFFHSVTVGALPTARHTATHSMEHSTERRVLLTAGRRRQVLGERVMDQVVAQARALGTVQAVVAPRYPSIVLLAYRLIRRPKGQREARVPRAV